MPYPRVCVFAAVLAAAIGAYSPLRADPGDIKGSDVMGDKSRSANDGWTQAPVPREQSAGKDAPDPGGQSTKQNASRPVPDAGSSDNSGNDPGQTVEAHTPSPSDHNPAAPTR